MRLALSTVALVACTSLASAADLGGPYGYDGSIKDGPVATHYNWSGLYVGGHVGYADGEWDGITKSTAGNPPNDYSGIDDPDQSIDGNGWFGGGQLGYNWQVGQFVVGVETDVSWTGVDGSGTWVAYGNDGGNAWRKRHDLEIDYFGTARVRFGYAANRFMPYITGGFAWAKTTGDLAVTQYAELTGVEAGTSYADADETHVGWTIGGGLEALLSDRWSLKAEYLYVDLGKEDYHFKGKTYGGANYDTDRYESDLSFHTVRLGVNYKFGH